MVERLGAGTTSTKLSRFIVLLIGLSASSVTVSLGG
jgi:hypothetical protein